MFDVVSGHAQPHLSEAFVTLLLFLAQPAQAHIALTYPPPRYTAQKDQPCGRDPDAAQGNPTVFAPGETITVQWNETINHPSHYRISFDDDGHDDFANPPVMKDFYSNPTVILDNIADNEPSGTYLAQITLPNVECEGCTLQLIQVMYDKPPYDPGPYGNDMYYQCADIALREGGGPTGDTGGTPGTPTGDTAVGGTTPPGTTPPPNTGLGPVTPPPDLEEGNACGCATPAPMGSSAAVVGLLGLLGWRRRR